MACLQLEFPYLGWPPGISSWVTRLVAAGVT
jgi:hypothetical protein